MYGLSGVGTGFKRGGILDFECKTWRTPKRRGLGGLPRMLVIFRCRLVTFKAFLLKF